MLFRQLFATLVSLCLLGPVTARMAAAAEEPATTQKAPALVATVLAAEGVVQVRDDEDAGWRIAQRGMTFPVGGEVRTGPKSKLVFTLPPEQIVTVDRLTQVKILEAVRSSGKFHSDLGMLYGRMRYDVEAGGLEHEAVIRAPSSALAVRGTSVEVQDDAFGSNVVLCRGLADATINNSRKVELRTGDQASAAPTTQPTSQPVAYVRRIDMGAGANCIRVNDRYKTVADYSYGASASTTSQSGALSDPEQGVVGYNSQAGGLEAGLHGFVPGSGSGGSSGLSGANDIIPPPNPIIGEGKLTFSLTWTGDGSTGAGLPDLDLAVTSPTGKKYSPAVNPGTTPDGVVVSPKGPVGSDVTAGVQTVYWPKNCPTGTYNYSVHYNGTGDPAVFTVQVLLNGKQISPVFEEAVLTELDPHVDFSIDVPPAEQAAAAKAKAKAKQAAAKAGAKPAVKPVAVVKAR
ncbi:MAG: FecR domain-containing protein [Tepidisphaerales bacterium]